MVGFSTGDSRKYFANPSVVPVLFGMFISWADPIRAALDNTIRTLDAVSAGHCLWQLWRPTIEGFTGLSDHRPMRVPQVNYEAYGRELVSSSLFVFFGVDDFIAR